MGAESKDPEDISIRKCRVKAFSRKSYVSSVARDPLYLYSVVCADLRDIFFKKYFQPPSVSKPKQVSGHDFSRAI